jgi:hypothetical protein
MRLSLIGSCSRSEQEAGLPLGQSQASLTFAKLGRWCHVGVFNES